MPEPKKLVLARVFREDIDTGQIVAILTHILSACGYYEGDDFEVIFGDVSDPLFEARGAPHAERPSDKQVWFANKCLSELAEKANLAKQSGLVEDEFIDRARAVYIAASAEMKASPTKQRISQIIDTLKEVMKDL